jgi:hypothetical protein
MKINPLLESTNLKTTQGPVPVVNFLGGFSRMTLCHLQDDPIVDVQPLKENDSYGFLMLSRTDGRTYADSLKAFRSAEEAVNAGKTILGFAKRLKNIWSEEPLAELTA